jgi:hypothetical protein
MSEVSESLESRLSMAAIAAAAGIVTASIIYAAVGFVLVRLGSEFSVSYLVWAVYIPGVLLGVLGFVAPEWTPEFFGKVWKAAVYLVGGATTP